MHCCTGFENLISCAGERGHAILACKISSGAVKFLLQSRGVAFVDEQKLKPIPIDVKINISAEVGLQFCPTCGRNLDELVQEAPDYFSKLAEDHAKYLASMPGL